MGDPSADFLWKWMRPYMVIPRRCIRCGHQLVGGVHWDTDDGYRNCPCTDEDLECIPDD